MARLSDVFLKKDRAKTVKIWRKIKGVPFLIGSTMNGDYTDAINNNVNDDDDNFYNELFVKYIFLGFKGLVNDDDNDLEDTIENRLSLIKDYPEIVHEVSKIAKNPDNFLGINNLEDELGN